MKINYLHVEQLHGYLSFDIFFRPDLTFLIGINGSGKTSAVRAVMALLGPAVRDLARLDFRSLRVSITQDNMETVVSASRDEGEITLRIDGLSDELRIPILPRPTVGPRMSWDESEMEYYREQEATNARHPVLERLAQLPTPMFLDLERRAQVGVVRRPSEMRAYRERHLTTTLLSGTLLESLRDAEALAEATFRQNQARLRSLADRLKQDLILTHFRRNERAGMFSMSVPTKEDMKKLRQRQRLINESLLAIGISYEEIQGVVAGFFEAVYEISAKLSGEDVFDLLGKKGEAAQFASRWIGLQPQLERINSVIHHVEEYNKKVEDVYRPIQRYLSLVNSFLRDSGKQLDFTATGDIHVLIEGKEKRRPITALSSGERQLVVILTHLAFNEAARDANVLIIDEPELSLHVRWQEQFVDALLGASEDLQIILATHSPSIIMDRDAACIDVMGARS